MTGCEFDNIINFDHEDRQIMNLMKYYGLAQYPGLVSAIRKLGSDTIPIKPTKKQPSGVSLSMLASSQQLIFVF
jgi:hypothetical protein